jgi:rare lipoprotein A (peptidoglycan hydrolase)
MKWDGTGLPRPIGRGNVPGAEGGRDTANTRRRTAWTTLIAVTAAAAGLVPSGALAASVSSRRSEAAAVLHRIDLLDWRRSHLAARERTASARLRILRESISAYRGAMRSQHAALEADQAALASLIVGDYKTGTSDTASYVLASGSFADLVQRVDDVSRINSSSASLIKRIHVSQRMLAKQEVALAGRYADVARERSRLDAARRGLDDAIASRQAVLASIDSQIAAQLNAERRRRASLASTDGGVPPPETGGQGGFTGEASWYGPGFAGHRTADGEIFDPTKLTAASPWLPFNTMLRVTDLATGRSVVVRINDRGPFGRGVLDLSAHAAQVVGLSGWAEVQATVL